jgi:hypothetical protein
MNEQKYRIKAYKLRSFCTAKETMERVKRLPIQWEEMFVSHSSYRALISKYIKNSKKLTTKEQVIQSITRQIV